MSEKNFSYVIRPVAHIHGFYVEGKLSGFLCEKCFTPRIGMVTTVENGSKLFIGDTLSDIIQQYFNDKKEK